MTPFRVVDEINQGEVGGVVVLIFTTIQGSWFMASQRRDMPSARGGAGWHVVP